ncbi:MAG: dihydrofolate reductase [Ignavibacteriales bacterium]|nr:dihydrofolate reductase [Ignavibacteriales bacterium]MBP9121104.1 dihydrofolate reductase [Ignavibacterium sp.]
MIISLIVAIAQNGVIGKSNGEMSWHVKEEFQHFKNTTLGFPIIMGRKTFETLGKPLKGRLNIVVSKNQSYKTLFDDVVVESSLDKAIEHCKNINSERIFIIGGGEIYRQAIAFVDEMIITFMKFQAEGEVKFPKINDGEWKRDKIKDHELFEIFRYLRKS